MGMDLNSESSLQDVIEARYREWEQEFGDEFIELRASTITPNEEVS